MSTRISCLLDTTPMADEIRTVSRHVVGTTTAVVTMQSAVIEAENKGAQKVCSNVNRGFLTVLRSQVSQKIANKQSRVEALLIQLSQQKRQLLNVKNNMEREYGRITARYLRIFTSINKELEQRIRQIDQPIFDLVNKHMAGSTNRMNALCSWVSTSQSECITKSQQIIASNMKHNAQKTLEQAIDFLTIVREQRILTDKVLLSNCKGNHEHLYFIPVMVYETISNPQAVKNIDIKLPDEISERNKKEISAYLLSEASIKWEKDERNVNIDNEFEALLKNTNLSSRVKSTIQKMYVASNYYSL